MGIYASHLISAVTILNAYDGKEPFHLYLKKYFAADKKYGSKDRKQIASLCYNYFRLGHAAKDISTEERVLFADKLVNGQWAMDNGEWKMENIFPFSGELSKGIDAEKFNLSFLVQPKLFLRIRPGSEEIVFQKLSAAAIEFEKISECCIAFPNSSKIDSVIELNKEAVVQDYNSQRTGELLRSTINEQLTTNIWDCCAASGGKSIMAYDLIPNIELTVSDKRESILKNLHRRFVKAGINNYHSFVADLSKLKIQNSKFDLIICDAPCTGSGTWSRTPEQLFYFQKESIEKYANLQKKIVQNVIPSLKARSHLLYITCSVFKKENEEVVEFIQQNSNLQLKKMELLKGYEIQADTLFAALFTGP